MWCPFPLSMNRLIAATLLTVTLGACAMTSSAAAAEHCRPRPGEHQLARSAQAIVLERIVAQSQHFPLQTITGCSERDYDWHLAVHCH
jgi:hypothetical protein